LPFIFEVQKMDMVPQINPNVSVDCVIFSFDGSDLEVLLIERMAAGTAVEDDLLALPGNLIYQDENLDQAANRVLLELTGLENIFLEQVYTFGDPSRITKQKDQDWLKKIRAHPEARVITVAYTSLVKKSNLKVMPSSFARKALWIKIKDVPQLAFDHNDILEKALEFLKQKIYTQPLGYELLPERFTLAQLQKLYEAILDDNFDKRNFRRKILRSSFIVALDEKQKGVAHKPARLYKFDKNQFHQI
jgi:8-oxo-dGTP diphosphatase